jgi:hypothetical protein
LQPLRTAIATQNGAMVRQVLQMMEKTTPADETLTLLLVDSFPDATHGRNLSHCRDAV